MKKIIFIALLTGSNLAQAELSATAGGVLLDSFNCDSTNGSNVQNIKNSLGSLKSTLEKIADTQKECAADFASIGKLPDINSIVSQIDNYGGAEDIKAQENIITEALSDLAQVKGMAPNAPNRAYYPDEATLQSIVVQARVQLINLRGQYGIAKGKADRQKYLAGVSELDSLATELAGALQKNSPCFQKNPIARRQVLSGLVGIAGFFAKTPAGIGITLAGRVLQNVFNISDSNEINNNQNFESSHQALLAAGISCTLENLSTQHCRLVRQSSLLKQLKEPPCQGNNCSPELRQLMNLVEKGKSATDAVSNVTSWLGGKTANTSDQATASKINSDFLSATSIFESAAAGAKEKARMGAASALPEVQKQNQFNSVNAMVRTYAMALYGRAPNDPYGAYSGGGGNGGGNGGGELQSLFTSTEKKRGPLNFIFDDKELDTLLAETAASINSSSRLKQKFGVEGMGGTAGEKTPEDAAIDALTRVVSGTEYPDLPAAQKVKDRMTGSAVFDNMNARLAQYKSQIIQRTTVQPKDEQISNFMIAFQNEQLGQPSTLRNLQNIQEFFDSLPADFVKSRGAILNISGMKKEIDEVVAIGKSMDAPDSEISKEKLSDLFAKTNRLLDPAHGFKEKLANLTSAAASYQTQKISRSAKNPQDINNIIFIQNKDFLESVYNMKNPYEKEVDTNTAIALSAAQLDSFGRFFQSYMDPALNMLNKKDIRNNNYSDGLSQNIDRSLKDHFCIQTLGLTLIPDRIKAECDNVVLRSGTNELHFHDFVAAPHQDRVCAYRNFVHKIDMSSYQKSDSLQRGTAK